MIYDGIAVAMELRNYGITEIRNYGNTDSRNYGFTECMTRDR